MNFTTETQNEKLFLLYHQGKNDVLNTESLLFLISNKLEQVLQFDFLGTEETNQVRYDITGLVNLKNYFRDIVSKQKLLSTLLKLLKLIESEAFSGVRSSLLIDSQYIFVNEATGEVKLLALPLSENPLPQSGIVPMLKGIMTELKFDPNEDCKYVAILINQLNDTEKNRITDIILLLHELLEEKEERPVEATVMPSVLPQELQNSGVKLCMQCKAVLNPKAKFCTKCGFKVEADPVSESSQFVCKSCGKKFDGVYRFCTACGTPSAPEPSIQESIQESPAEVQPSAPEPPASDPVHTETNFGETTVLGIGAIGETTVLSQNNLIAGMPFIIRVKTGEKMDIDKTDFLIGKDCDNCDFVILNNSAISRIHLQILADNGEYYAIDKHSTNHSFIDGRVLQKGVPVKINHGEHITLADEEFEFRLF